MTTLFEEIAEESSAYPFFESGIEQGDVIEVLRSLDVNTKFDVVIADPPYNIGKDFGVTQDNMPLSVYVDWTERWLDRCFELLVDDGIIYVYGFPEILAHIATRYSIDKQRWLVWHYTNKATPSSSFWQRSHESILCLWHPDSRRPKLEIDQIREPYSETYKNCIGRVRKGTKSRFGNGKETIYNGHENGAMPRDVIKIPALAGGAGANERWFICHDCNDNVFSPSSLKDHVDHNITKHPTQKPSELTRRLLLSRITNNDGRVLVPFSGSGSECVVAKSLGIEYLGIEIDPLFVDLSRKWLETVKCIN